MNTRGTKSVSRSNSRHAEIAALRARLQEAEELLRALKRGEVDAIVQSGPSGDQVFTLTGAERPYRLMVETMSEGALTLAPGGVILYCNQRFADLVKADLDQVIGARVDKFIVAAEVAKFNALMQSAEAESARDRFNLMCSDGTPVPTHIAMRGLHGEENPSIVVVVTDLSEMIRAESKREQLARIVENARDGIIGMDLNTIVTSWNKGAERIFGYSASEVVGRKIETLVLPERKHVLPELVTKVRRGEIIAPYETQVLCKSGQRRDVTVSISPLTDSAGVLVGASSFVQDISEQRKLAERDAEIAERKRTEAEIRQLVHDLEKQVAATDHAEAANRAKSVFLANMSHELRTPLNVILGFSRLIANDRQATAEQVQKSDIIVRSGEKLLHLIDNVLNIAKIEAGRVDLEQVQFDLHQLLHEAHQAIQVRAVEKGLGFTIDLSADLPRYVTADSGKLHQVLMNLIGNAIKFTKTGGVTLRAKVENWESPQRALLSFEIEDSGSGIREEDRQRIFSPFVQLTDQPPAEPGTGLGLVISEQYVKLMGGHVGVTSERGKGSIFRFDIPVTVDHDLPDAGPAHSPRRRVTGIAEGQQRYRLLIAEDHADNCLLLRSILEPLGFDIREAVNGQEAVLLCETWHPHLIWMDVRMPVMNGLDATRQIRKIDPGGETKIVAVTAHALEDERNEILAAGCDDFIRKTYAETEIFDALAKHLGVRFVYAEERLPPSAGKAGFVSVTQLEKLPSGLLRGLCDAAVLLDGPRCLALVGSIDADERELRGRLQRMVDNLQYSELIQLLDSAIAVRSA